MITRKELERAGVKAPGPKRSGYGYMRDRDWECRQNAGPGVFIPIYVTTMGNNRKHWYAQAEITRKHRALVGSAVMLGRLSDILPDRIGNGLRVQLTRYAPGTLDEFGNLPSAFKAVVDEIAAFYRVDDADPRWTWLPPIQVKTKRGQYGIRVEIWSK